MELILIVAEMRRFCSLCNTLWFIFLFVMYPVVLFAISFSLLIYSLNKTYICSLKCIRIICFEEEDDETEISFIQEVLMSKAWHAENQENCADDRYETNGISSVQ